jgi:hypothetical protein
MRRQIGLDQNEPEPERDRFDRFEPILHAKKPRYYNII